MLEEPDLEYHNLHRAKIPAAGCHKEGVWAALDDRQGRSLAQDHPPRNTKRRSGDATSCRWIRSAYDDHASADHIINWSNF